MTSQNTFSQGANDVRKRQLEFIIGQVMSTSPLARYIDLVNSYPQAAQVSTFAVTGGTGAGNTVSVVVNGIVKAYLTVSGDTTTTLIAVAMAELINSDPLLKGILTASSAVAVVTLTGMGPGDTFTLVAGTNTGSATLVTTAATANSIPFGVGLAFTGETSTVQQATFATKAASGVFVAQVATLTVNYRAAQVYNVSVLINETRYNVAVLATVDSATTATAIATAINALAVLTDLVTAAGVSATVTLTANTAGLEFDVVVGTIASPASDLTVAFTTGPDQTTSAIQAFAGACPWSLNVEQTAIGSNVSVIPPNDVYKGLEFGQIGVASLETVKRGARVWMELDDSGGLGGQFYAVYAATRVLLPRANSTWVGTPFGGADGYANLLLVNVAA